MIVTIMIRIRNTARAEPDGQLRASRKSVDERVAHEERLPVAEDLRG